MGPPPAPPNGLCRTVRGAYMAGWRMPMSNSGAMGSATDADEDAVTGLIYLAELLDDASARAYALRSIAAFVLEDLGLADPIRNSRRVPSLDGDIPDALQTTKASRHNQFCTTFLCDQQKYEILRLCIEHSH